MKAKMFVVTFVIALLGLTSLLMAEDWPLAKLKEKGVAATEMGEWSLAGYAGRGDFPFLTDRRKLDDVEEGQWVLPNHAAGFLKISEKTIYVRSQGMINNEDQDKWLGAVVFTAKEAGHLAVSGKITRIWSDANPDAKNNVKWAVLRANDKGTKFRVIASGVAGKDDEINLAEVEKLKAVKVDAGESLIVTLFRPEHWGASGGEIEGLAVTKTEAPKETE